MASKCLTMQSCNAKSQTVKSCQSRASTLRATVSPVVRIKGGSLGRREHRSLVTKAVEFKESTAVGTSDEGKRIYLVVSISNAGSNPDEPCDTINSSFLWHSVGG